jgi:hypothetical protein
MKTQGIVRFQLPADGGRAEVVAGLDRGEAGGAGPAFPSSSHTEGRQVVLSNSSTISTVGEKKL